MDNAPIGIRYGSCAAAVYLARQVTVADIESDALWEYRREPALHARLAGRLVDSHRRVGRTGGRAHSRFIGASRASRRRGITS